MVSSVYMIPIIGGVICAYVLMQSASRFEGNEGGVVRFLAMVSFVFALAGGISLSYITYKVSQDTRGAQEQVDRLQDELERLRNSF